MRKLNKKIWPYSIQLGVLVNNESPFIEYLENPRDKWLRQHLKDSNWYVVEKPKPTYYFKREKDMTWFLLNCS